MGGQVIVMTLFGSRARGAATVTPFWICSWAGTRRSSGHKRGALSGADALLDCGKFLSTRVWSRASLEAEQARPGGLYQNILRDGVPLWEDEAGAPLLESPLLKPRARRVSRST
jgi:hypothetical protein